MAAKDLVFGIKLDTRQAKAASKDLSKSLGKTSEDFDDLQKEVDQTNASLQNFQKSVTSVNTAQKRFSATSQMSFKAVEANNRTLLNTDKRLASNANLLKSNADRFKDLESSAAGSRQGLQLVSEVILGIPGDAVTKIFYSFEILNTSIQKGFTQSLQQAGVVIKRFAIAMKGLTVSIITNPLFISAAVIVAGIILVVKALQDLEERFGLLTEILDSVKALFGELDASTRLTASTFEVFTRMLKNIGIILVSGFVAPILLVLKALLRLKLALTDDAEEILALEGRIKGLDKQMLLLSGSTRQAFEELNPYTAAANIAAEKTKAFNKQVAENEKALKKQQKEAAKAKAELAVFADSARAAMKGTVTAATEAQLRIEVFGNEFEKARLNVQKARRALEKLQQQFGKTKKTVDQLKALTQASEEFRRSQLTLEKMGVDGIKNLSDQLRKSEMDLMQLRGEQSRIRSMQHKQAVKELDDFVRKLQKSGALSGKQFADTVRMQNEILANMKARIDLLDEQAKKQKEEDEARQKREKRRQAIEAGGEVSGLLEQASTVISGIGGRFVEEFTKMLSATAVGFGLEAAAVFVKAILALPDLLSGIASFLDKITDIGPNIAKALKEFATALVKLIVAFIPNLIKSVGEILDILVFDLALAIPDAIIAASEQIPEAFAKLFLRLPEIVQGFVRSLIVTMPKIAIAMVNGFIKQFTVMGPALIEALPDIGEAIIIGAMEAILEIAELIKRLFTGEDLIDTGAISDSVAEGIAASSSQIFQVVDLEQQRVGKDAGKFILDSTNKSISIWRRFWEFVERLWENITNNFQMAFQWIWDKFREAVDWIAEKILKPVFDPFIKAFEEVGNFLFDAIAGFIDLGKGLNFMFLDLVAGISKAWESLKDLVVTPLENLLGGMKSLFAAIMNPIIDIFNSLKIGPVNWEISAGKLGKASGQLIPEIDFIPGDIKRLQEGGLVLGEGIGDVIPAFLEPGEFVLNKQAVDQIGLGNLTAMNQGQGMQQGATTINYAPTINVSAQDFDPREIVENMFTELRRRSSNGTKVIFAQGIKQ